MGSLGKFTSHPPAAVLNLPGQALCHTLPPPLYVALLPGTGVGLGSCEPLPSPQWMWSGKWEHVECVCFDLSRLCSLQRIGFWYCLCLALRNRFTIFPLFLILQQDLRKKKNYTGHSSPEPDCIHYGKLRCVSEMILFGNA